MCHDLTVTMGQEAATGSDIEVARNLWLQPCADSELGAALYSNVAFAALKCGGSRTVDHVCLAAVVGAKPGKCLHAFLHGALFACALFL